jgi:hypothetical protein
MTVGNLRGFCHARYSQSPDASIVLLSSAVKTFRNRSVLLTLWDRANTQVLVGCFFIYFPRPCPGGALQRNKHRIVEIPDDAVPPSTPAISGAGARISESQIVEWGVGARVEGLFRIEVERSVPFCILAGESGARDGRKKHSAKHPYPPQ